MALTKISFTVITQEEFDDRRKVTAFGRNNSGIACHWRRMQAPSYVFGSSSLAVGVVSKLKKKSSRPPLRSSKVIPVNSYMEVVGFHGSRFSCYSFLCFFAYA